MAYIPTPWQTWQPVNQDAVTQLKGSVVRNTAGGCVLALADVSSHYAEILGVRSDDVAAGVGGSLVSFESGTLVRMVAEPLIYDVVYLSGTVAGSGTSRDAGGYPTIPANPVPLGIVYNKTQVGGVWFAFLFPLSTATGLVSLTNKGDIPSYDGNNPLVVPVGPITGYVLTVNPGAPTGFAWEELPGGSTIAPGILQLGTTAGTACEGNDVRLGAGGRPYSGRMVSVTRNANTSSRSKDGGLTWILGANPPTGGWYGVVWDPVHSVFVTLSNGATNPGGSQYSVDAGATWTTGGQLSATIQTWYRLFYDPAHASIVAVPRLQTTGAVRSTDGGVSWVVSASTFPSVGFTYGCYDPDHQRVVYVSETSTDTLYTADGGVTWLPGGALPGGLQTSISYDPVHHRLVSLPVSPNTQSAYSTDGGTTWSAGGSVPITGGTWFGNCYDPVHRVIIGVNDVTTQTIYSADGGLTWNNGGTLAAPAAVRTMVWDPVSALIYFVYNGNTVAYYSENGGATWTSVTSPVTFGPGLAVAYP